MEVIRGDAVQREEEELKLCFKSRVEKIRQRNLPNPANIYAVKEVTIPFPKKGKELLA